MKPWVTLNCGYSSAGGENLQVNWGGNRFHLTALTTASCFDNPAVDEGQPKAGFDTLQGTGTGQLNGVDGYKAQWRFRDAGEPGVNDTAELSISDPDGNVILNVSGLVRNGNHQAHKD